MKRNYKFEKRQRDMAKKKKKEEKQKRKLAKKQVEEQETPVSEEGSREAGE